MSGLNPQVLVGKLNRLNNSQQSIETLSAWCTFYRKDAKKVVMTWEAEFAQAPMQKKMAMLYLANDILQNSRKKGPEFVHEYHRTLPRALQHTLKHGDDKVQEAVGRLIAIWEERKVFGLSGSKSFKELIAAAETPRKGAAKPAVNGAADTAQNAALAPLCSALSQLAGLAPQLAHLEPSCSAPVSEAILQSGNIRELEDRRQLLAQYEAALQAEAAAHERAISFLRALLSQQEESKQAGEGKLHMCQRQIAQFNAQISATTRSPPPPEMEEEVLYSPTVAAAGMRGDAWDPEPEPDEAAAPQAPAALPAKSPGSEARHMEQQQQQQHPAAEAAAQAHFELAMGRTASGGANADDNAAALAAQLAASGGAARLLEALAALPKEQQHEIGRDLAALVQPAEQGMAQPHPRGETPEDEEEYDPEQGGMEF